MVESNDLAKLPDLAYALDEITHRFHEGNFAPPHLPGFENKSADSYGILAWYAKTKDGVIGIVRVSWRYGNGSNAIIDSFFDDKYFIIEYGSQEIHAIDRDDLLLKVTDVPVYIYHGDYGPKGKILSFWAT